MQCPSCGNENPSGASFCNSCGSSLQVMTSSRTSSYVMCSLPGCGREVDLYSCDRCGKPYCQLHVSFDVLMPVNGWGLWAVTFKLPYKRKYYKIICDPCNVEVTKELKKSQNRGSLLMLLMSLIICCVCVIAGYAIFSQI